MLKVTRWKGEKNKIRVVFKLQFHASQVNSLGWEIMMVSLVPLDVGKATMKTDKVLVIGGHCHWRNPIYETVKLFQDSNTGKMEDKLYKFVVSANGIAAAATVGEITVNLADYFESAKPTSASLPLKPSKSGIILHVTIQRMHADLEVSSVLDATAADSSAQYENYTISVKSETEQLELSDLELENLITMESNRGEILLRKMNCLKGERDELKRECEELKASQRKTDSNTLSLSVVEEIKQELQHERSLNANLRLQLHKTQEANSELILAVQDLEQLLEQKNTEIACQNCTKICIKQPIQDISEMNFAEGNSNVHVSECEELFETTSDGDDEQYQLDVLVNRDDKVDSDLKNNIDVYKENADLHSKLEQARQEEIINQQRDCSENSATISDLKEQIKVLKNELQERSRAYDASLEVITNENFKQQKRAKEAEDALWMTRLHNAKITERLQEEFEILAGEITSTFHMNEKLAIQVLAEANEIHLQKCHLEEQLEQNKADIAVLQERHEVKSRSYQTWEKHLNHRIEELERDLLRCDKEGMQNIKHNLDGDCAISIDNELALSHEIISLEGEEEDSKSNKCNQNNLAEMLIQEQQNVKYNQDGDCAISIDNELTLSHEDTTLEEKEQDSKSKKCSRYNLTEMLHEMAMLRENNKSTEAELKEMQQRYTQISLRFAEVEGERQQLVMTTCKAHKIGDAQTIISRQANDQIESNNGETYEPPQRLELRELVASSAAKHIKSLLFPSRMAQSKSRNSKSKKQHGEMKKNGKQDDIAQLRSQLDALSLQIIRVTADGNCFFRSLADQLEGNEQEHEIYRKMVVQYIKIITMGN
ncbi:hypothetical protein HPP92_014357 [Vanilla planifolia]|uniref:OTU domain-containing protein n=1 Tax=Vanilla planifolia TaxID=51239 RepID=A0A835UWT4_VANPL|nr:hypothetical protein HPP92_014357 [Vanilla planifolia]